MAATLTPQQQEAAREAKAAKERQRRADLKTAKAQLEKAGLDPETKLDAGQRKRAVESKVNHAGLSGRSLAKFILEGKTVAEQIEDGRAEQAAVNREERTRANTTSSKDPEASEIAAAAKKLAPDVKSSFLPKEGREFLDLFTVTAEGQTITVKRSGAQGLEGALEEAAIKRADLRKFAIDGEKDKDVRAVLSGLGKGTRLWGRKLGLMILAADARR